MMVLRAGDAEALRLTTRLVQFLAEVTENAARSPIKDVLLEDRGGSSQLTWLDDLPKGVRVTDRPDGLLLRLHPPKRLSEPPMPEELSGSVEWVEKGSGGKTPVLRGGTGQVSTYKSWQTEWKEWHAEEQRLSEIRSLYGQLENAAKLLEQQDDEYEFVLVAGFVSWMAPDGTVLRRHLVSEPLIPTLDRETAEVMVHRGSGQRRLEDKELFEDQEGYRPERGAAAKSAMEDSDTSLLDPGILAGVEKWLGAGLDHSMQTVASRADMTAEPGPTVQLCAAPMMWLRPRSRVLLAEAYRHIATELEKPNAEVPVALAQLVVETERAQRDRWLEDQGAMTGDLLGADPLFPLPTNAQQERVMDLLRTETAVVVQGPPGTGKTHTIANLISALLARGQRVLVTSQKEQALNVLRDEIPEKLRKLCVLVAGGSRDATGELQLGLDALNSALTSNSSGELADKAAVLAQQRCELGRTSTKLNRQIFELRDAENTRYEAVIQGDAGKRYRGTLADIVQEVHRNEPVYGWIPAAGDETPGTPPLSTAEFIELRRLLRTDTPARQLRKSQTMPAVSQLPSAGEAAQVIAAELNAEHDISTDIGTFDQNLARLGEEPLRSLHLSVDGLRAALRSLGYAPDGSPPADPIWIGQAVADLLSDRRAVIWDPLLDVRGEPERLQRLHASIAEHEVDLGSIPQSLGEARSWLKAGRALREHLQQGGKINKIFKSGTQREADPFLSSVRVDGKQPTTVDTLDLALAQLEVEIRATQLTDQWAHAGVEIPGGSLVSRLTVLMDHGKMLDKAASVATIGRDAANVLEQASVAMDLSTAGTLLRTLEATEVALRFLELEKAKSGVERLVRSIDEWASRSDACPELNVLRDAAAERDAPAYAHALQMLDHARRERDEELRFRQLTRQLEDAHPHLLEMLRNTSHDPVWDDRLTSIQEAWAWAQARRFVLSHRTLGKEMRLTAEFDAVEQQLERTTVQLAAVEATRMCLDRMTETNRRALNTYRAHKSHAEERGGRQARRFGSASRQAMAKAKGAVPAWVVALPNLLDNLAPERNSFDVVIVDEASQVGLEHLFLLWMAPRLIVVGDDKQCTPGPTRMGRLDTLFRRLDDYLGDLPDDIRLHFTSKANLFGLLSARSGKDSLVALREHFRSVPQIINWSSTQFYGQNGAPGLIPLREHRANDLKPLQVVMVSDADTIGRERQKRNPKEAEAIVAQIVECLNDPKYEDKTIGVIVLQGIGQIRLLETAINSATTPEQRAHHKIRVGTPPNFQGDQRDVIFLSMVVAETPPARRATIARQAFNVAASRAREQMWLFTSVSLTQLKTTDLRASLLSYMLNPPSTYGRSPSLEEVSATKPCKPFDSLFEQRVFRAIRARGFHVVPQHQVGSWRLDLVIVGEGGRLAVECDGHYWHTTLDREASDARRDLELRRMRWEVLRVRESEFEFDPEQALEPLWQRLAQRGIEPTPVAADEPEHWNPIDLPEAEDPENETDVA
ncbi:AAA family ATPase [Nocardia otitidiscaviarum]|uniref:AAA domain-containing protein n=1 Tax=Nocardia otitidiscaviarum TaxID=1823 RepID=UPI00189385B9|nr:AAA domain-containing protein [Nocardia otitidiscaviarum]MBF6240883.1 AAA family ATPase [Nocardia otitidiscaviarum]